MVHWNVPPEALLSSYRQFAFDSQFAGWVVAGASFAGRGLLLMLWAIPRSLWRGARRWLQSGRQ